MLALLTKLFGKKFIQSIMGTRTNVQVLKTAKNNPFTNNFSKQALKDDPTMLADAESVMQKYAGNALSNKNTAESAQFLKNLKTLDEVKNPVKAKVYEFETKKEMPKKVKEGIEKVKGGDPDTLQGNMQSMMSLIDEMRGITPTMRVAKNRQELADFIRKMRGKKFSNEEIQMVKDYTDMYSMSLAKEKLAPAIIKTKQMGGKGKSQIELTEDYMDTLKMKNQEDFKDFYTVGQTNHQIREAMVKDLRAQGLGDDIIEQVDDELYQLSHDQTGSAFDRVTTASHPANWVKRAGDEIEMITGTKMDTKFYENWGNEVLSKYKGKPEFASGGRASFGKGKLVKGFFEFVEGLFIKASNDIRQGKGLFKGLTDKQKWAQHDNLTKMVEKWQKTKTLPEGAEQYFGVDAKKAFAAASQKVKKTDPLVSDDVLAKAYDEVFYQKPASGDYKYDADVLADSIAEQLGKGSLDDFSQVQQTEIYNSALKRVQQDLQIKRAKKIAEKNLTDLEQKVELQMFDPKDRKPNAYGGIAGQLHLNQGGRARFQDGLSADYDLTGLQDPFQPLEDRGLQSHYLRDIMGGKTYQNFAPADVYSNWLNINKQIDPWRWQVAPTADQGPGHFVADVDPYSKDFNIQDYIDRYSKLVVPGGQTQPGTLNIKYNPQTGELARVKALSDYDKWAKAEGHGRGVGSLPSGATWEYFSGIEAKPDELQTWNPMRERREYITKDLEKEYLPEDVVYGPGTNVPGTPIVPTAAQAAPTVEQTAAMEDIQARGIDPRMARSYQENIRLMGDPRMHPPMPIGVMPPLSNEFTTEPDAGLSGQ